ncbi:unnamed protein product, partial [Owenia fusiformis]
EIFCSPIHYTDSAKHSKHKDQDIPHESIVLPQKYKNSPEDPDRLLQYSKLPYRWKKLGLTPLAAEHVTEPQVHVFNDTVNILKVYNRLGLVRKRQRMVKKCNSKNQFFC